MRFPPNPKNYNAYNIITYSVPSVESFKAINDYRSRNGPKGQKVQLRHFLSNYLLDRARITKDLFTICNRKIDSFGNE